MDESDLKARSSLRELADPAARPSHAIVPVDAISKITLGAIEMAQAITSEITVVHLTDDAEQAEKFQARWNAALPDVPLLVIESPYRAFAAPMLAYIESLERTEADRRITVILPGFKAHHWWESLLHNRAIGRLKPFLAQYPNIRVVDFMYDVQRNGSARPPSPHPVSA